MQFGRDVGDSGAYRSAIGLDGDIVIVVLQTRAMRVKWRNLNHDGNVSAVDISILL